MTPHHNPHLSLQDNSSAVDTEVVGEEAGGAGMEEEGTGIHNSEVKLEDVLIEAGRVYGLGLRGVGWEGVDVLAGSRFWGANGGTVTAPLPPVPLPPSPTHAHASMWTCT